MQSESRVEPMDGYGAAYMIGNLLTESIIRTLGELCEGAT